jgi:hypothetical protein
LKQSQVLTQKFAGLYENGKPRLGWARSQFLQGGEYLDLVGLVGFYREWRDFVEYGVIQKQEWTRGSCKKTTLAVKCAKRGNDVYRRRVQGRMAIFGRSTPLGGLGGDVEFFSWKDDLPKVSVVFVTLTWKGDDIAESWLTIGDQFNRWITNLRERFGRLSYARTWESTKRGVAHVHLMIQFHDWKFSGFKSVDQDGSFVWRISEKPEFEKSWPAFVDVRAVRTYSSVLRYLEKRVLQGTDEDLNSDAGDLTMALLWIFRKRSFALSRDFQEKLSDLIRALHNSKVQVTLEGEVVEESWIWLGVFSGVELSLDGSVWCVELPGSPSHQRGF